MSSLLDGGAPKSDEATTADTKPVAASSESSAPAPAPAPAAAAAPAPTKSAPAAASKPATATSKAPTKSPAKPVLLAGSKPAGAVVSAGAKSSASPRGAAPGTVSAAAAANKQSASAKDEKHVVTGGSGKAVTGSVTPKKSGIRTCKHCKYPAQHSGRFCLNCGRSLITKQTKTYACRHCKLISVNRSANCPNCKKAYGTAPARKELGPCDNHNDQFAYQTCSNCEAKVCDTCVKTRDQETGAVVCVECSQQGEFCDYFCFVCAFCATACDKAAKVPTGRRKNYDFTADDTTVTSPSAKSTSKQMSRG